MNKLRCPANILWCLFTVKQFCKMLIAGWECAMYVLYLADARVNVLSHIHVLETVLGYVHVHVGVSPMKNVRISV